MSPSTAAPSPGPPDWLSVFNVQPGANLLLSPEWVIVGASDDYLAATLTDRATIVGQHIFAAFPENPQAPEANAEANVRASLAQVLATRQPHEMAPQHYDVPDRTRPGHFVERHWQPRHTPVLDAAGQVQFIIQSVQDITASRRAQQLLSQAQAAEQAARADAETQRQRLYRVLMNLPARVATYHGPEHVYTLVNRRYQDYFPAHTLLGRSVREAIPEVGGQGFFERLDQVYATGEPVYGQELPAQLGSADAGQPPKLVYVNTCYLPLRDAEGSVDGVLDFSYDVTEQVLARRQVEQLNHELESRVQERAQQLEQAQADAQARQAALLAAARQQVQEREAFHHVFEQTPALIALLRAPGHRFEYVNPAYQAIFPGRALVGRDLAEAAPELAAQGFVALLDRVYRTGETYFGAEVRFTPPPAPGQPAPATYYNFTYQAYREGGQVAGISIFAYDVTEQVRARQQRETHREQLQAVFAQAPVAVCVFRGEEYVFDLVNPTMGQILGQPPAALVGRPFFAVVPELRSQGLPALLAGVYRTGTPFVAQEQELQLAHHAPGRPGYYNYVYEPLRADDGRVTGVVCVATDVTEQVRARQRVQELNQELAATNKQLQATNEELGDSNQQLMHTNVDLDNFIYTASHDLKAPISNIEGLLYLLQEELPTEVAQGAEIGPTLTRMLDAVERFKRTIDHLTDVSKLQKEHEPAATLVNLATVIEDVRQDLSPLLHQTGAKVVVDVAALPPVQFPEKNLRSIVYNLLSNAVKYHSPDRPPRVDVRAHVRPGHTVLEVHDNGLGLAPAQLPKLFGMFQRFHDHVEGTGIGLYMVKRMVENAGGRLEVHSQLGAGTTFLVFLPHTDNPGAHPFPAFLPS